MKICPVGAEMFHADRQKDRRIDWRTDMTQLIVAFHNCANAPKNATDGERRDPDDEDQTAP